MHGASRGSTSLARAPIEVLHFSTELSIHTVETDESEKSTSKETARTASLARAQLKN